MSRPPSRLLVSVFVIALSGWACDSSNPIAPAGTILTVSASPTLIGLNDSSRITVSGFRPDGNPLNPGTRIQLTTDLGVLEPTVVEIDADGRGTATLRPDGRTGPATITARTTSGDAEATATVQIGNDDTTRPRLTVNASPSTANLGEEVLVTLIAQNADGTPFAAGGRIRLETTLGQLRENVVFTDGNGRASTILDAGDQVGTATITAFLESAEPAMATVMIENQRPTLIVTITPNDVRTNQNATITILARDENSQPLGGGFEIDLFATLGCFPPEPRPDCTGASTSRTVTTDGGGRVETVYNAGDRAGTAQITAILGSSEPVMSSVMIRDVVAVFELLAPDPSSIDPPTQGGQGQTVSLTARVQNSLGQPIVNVTVNFRSDVGGAFAPSSSVLTDSSGLATTRLTVTTAQITPDNEDTGFIVRATVVAEVADGVNPEQTEMVGIRRGN